MDKRDDIKTNPFLYNEGMKLKLRESIEQVFTGSFVVESFPYHGITMDYAIIVKDRLIEVCHVTSKAEYIAELGVHYRSGKKAIHKHGAFKKGSFISSAFYFLAPTRILLPSEIEEHYGLMTYETHQLEVKIRTEADYIKVDDFLSKDFYKTLAKNAFKKYYEPKNITGLRDTDSGRSVH
jgi:hypothetical protein